MFLLMTNFDASEKYRSSDEYSITHSRILSLYKYVLSVSQVPRSGMATGKALSPS